MVLTVAVATIGYDPAFLPGIDPLEIPTADDLTALAYIHFTVLLRSSRRLAAITAVNIDGPELASIGRADDWKLDPRVPDSEQAGPEIYRDNDLDRGHLVRRRDPVWGAAAIAAQANLDTFHYTVCAPQTATFNQGRELWAGLEDYILDHTDTYDQKLSVFTGCMFTDTDPTYRGLAIPRRFFKIAAWTTGSALAATGYVLDQTPSLDPAIRVDDTEIPPLGPYRTFQVPIADIADLTALPMATLVTADRYDRSPTTAVDAATRGWKELTTSDDLEL